MTGARNLFDVRNLAKWREINPEFKTMDDVLAMPPKLGIVEDWIFHEGNAISRAYGDRGKGLMRDLVSLFKKDPYAEDTTVVGVLKKHGFTESLMNAAGYFMRKSERFNRTYGFLASYLQARESVLPVVYEKWDAPYLIDTAKKAMQTAQFLYSNANRQAFGRTNLGAIFTRFKHWAWQNVRFQGEIIRQAAYSGYRPGSVEMERFERMFAANVFALGLASLLPYTIFESALPPPLNYFQDLADWMFGNKKERERAFFAGNIGLPSALAPLNTIMPSIARLPKGIYDLPSTFGLIWGGELQRIGEFTTYSLFPFGRLGKDLARAWDSPELATQFLLGIPAHAIGRVKRKKEKEK
jgi:hypothetical protein